MQVRHEQRVLAQMRGSGFRDSGLPRVALVRFHNAARAACHASLTSASRLAPLSLSPFLRPEVLSVPSGPAS